MKLHSKSLPRVLLSLTLCAVPAFGSPINPTPIKLPSPRAISAQGIEGGFWRTDGNFEPILHVKNILLKQPLNVTPSLIFADGTQWKLDVIHLAPAGVASVDLRRVIDNLPEAMHAHVSQYGMASLTYSWAWPAVSASIQNTDEIASLTTVSSPLATISVVHQLPEDNTSRILRGTWWKPTINSDFVLAIGNPSLTIKQVEIRVSDHLGQLLTTKSLRLASHSMTVTHLNDLLLTARTSDRVGDLTILFAGPKDGIVASASIEDQMIGYSATPHLIEQSPDARPAQAITIDAPGLMVGRPDPAMLFPTGTSFMPYGVLHNVSGHEMNATLSLTSDTSDGKTVTRTLDHIALAPGQSENVDFSRYFSPDNPVPDGYAHLSVAYQGQFEELIVDAGTVDQTGNYVFQVMPAGEVPTISRIFCYWTVEGDSSTMISIWNYSRSPQDATLILYYNGGQYRIPIHLAARKSFNLDTMTLVKSRVPDADGNLIPAYISSGSAMLVGPGGNFDRMNVVVSTSAYNVRNATCWPVCLNCNGLVSVSLANAKVVIHKTVQVKATAYPATGQPEVIDSGLWTISNGAIANVTQSGSVGGLAVGSTSVNFTIQAPPGVWTCFDSASDICEDQQFFASATVTVTAN